MRTRTLFVAACVIFGGWVAGRSISARGNLNRSIAFVGDDMRGWQQMKATYAISTFHSGKYTIAAIRDPHLVAAGSLKLIVEGNGEIRLPCTGAESHVISGEVYRIIDSVAGMPAVVVCDEQDVPIASDVVQQLAKLSGCLRRRGLHPVLAGSIIVCARARNVMRMWDRGFLGAKNLITDFEDYGRLDTDFAVASVIAQGVLRTRPLSWDVPTALRVWECAQSLLIETDPRQCHLQSAMSESTVLARRAAEEATLVGREAADPSKTLGGTDRAGRALRYLARLRAYCQSGESAAIQSRLAPPAGQDDPQTLLEGAALAARFLCPADLHLHTVAQTTPWLGEATQPEVVFAANYTGFLEDCGCKGRKSGGLLRLIDEWQGMSGPRIILGDMIAGPQTIRYDKRVTALAVQRLLATCTAYVLGANELAVLASADREVLTASGWLDRVVATNVVELDGTQRWAKHIELRDCAGRPWARVYGFFAPWGSSHYGCIEKVMQRYAILDPDEALRNELSRIPDGLTAFVCGNWLPDSKTLVGASCRVVVMCSDPRTIGSRYAGERDAWTLAGGHVGGASVMALDSYQYGYCRLRFGPEGPSLTSVKLFDDPKDSELLADARAALEAAQEGSARPVSLSTSQLAAVEAGSEYVGVETCCKCHARQVEAWNGTAHAHSMVTLESAQRHRAAECVMCHTTGFGTRSLQSRGQAGLVAVTCEACHGPGSVHASNQSKVSIIGRPSAADCLGCHDTDHSEMATSRDAYLARARHVCTGR